MASVMMTRGDVIALVRSLLKENSASYNQLTYSSAGTAALNLYFYEAYKMTVDFGEFPITTSTVLAVPANTRTIAIPDGLLKTMNVTMNGQDLIPANEWELHEIPQELYNAQWTQLASVSVETMSSPSTTPQSQTANPVSYYISGQVMGFTPPCNLAFDIGIQGLWVPSDVVSDSAKTAFPSSFNLPIAQLICSMCYQSEGKLDFAARFYNYWETAIKKKSVKFANEIQGNKQDHLNPVDYRGHFSAD